MGIISNLFKREKEKISIKSEAVNTVYGVAIDCNEASAISENRVTDIKEEQELLDSDVVYSYGPIPDELDYNVEEDLLDSDVVYSYGPIPDELDYDVEEDYVADVYGPIEDFWDDEEEVNDTVKIE